MLKAFWPTTIIRRVSAWAASFRRGYLSNRCPCRGYGFYSCAPDNPEYFFSCWKCRQYKDMGCIGDFVDNHFFTIFLWDKLAKPSESLTFLSMPTKLEYYSTLGV